MFGEGTGVGIQICLWSDNSTLMAGNHDYALLELRLLVAQPDLLSLHSDILAILMSIYSADQIFDPSIQAIKSSLQFTSQLNTPREQADRKGWGACPSDIVKAGQCFSNTIWLNKPDQSTTVSISQWYAERAYDRLSYSILQIVNSNKSSTILPWYVDYATLDCFFARVMTLTGNDTGDEKAAKTALLNQISLTLRFYQDYFPDDLDSPLDLLRGFVMVPFQFSGRFALAGANIGKGYALPDTLETSASLDGRGEVLRIPSWVLYVFMSMVVIIVVWMDVIVWIILSSNIPVPNSSQIPEFDVRSKPVYGRYTGSPFGEMRGNYPRTSYKGAGFGNAEAKTIAEGVAGIMIRVAATFSAICMWSHRNNSHNRA